MTDIKIFDQDFSSLEERLHLDSGTKVRAFYELGDDDFIRLKEIRFVASAPDRSVMADDLRKVPLSLMQGVASGRLWKR